MAEILKFHSCCTYRIALFSVERFVVEKEKRMILYLGTEIKHIE